VGGCKMSWFVFVGTRAYFTPVTLGLDCYCMVIIIVVVVWLYYL